MKTSIRMSTVYRFMLLLLLVVGFSYAQAKVELPNGEYNTRVDDLVVKVMGGEVVAQRAWYEGRWQFNRSWNPLQINRTLGAGSVGGLDSIGRNGDNYTRSSGSSIAVFVNTVLVRKNQIITVYDTLVPDTVLSEAALKAMLSTRAQDVGYRWADRKGNIILYNAQGRVVEYRDRNGVKVTILYDAAGRRSGVADHFGTQVLWYTYDANGKLTSVRDRADVAQARQVVYQWTGRELRTVTDVRGNDWHYSYTGAKTLLLKSKTDPDGRMTTIDYDGAQRVQKVTQPDGTTVRYDYSYDKTRQEYFVRLTYSSGEINENWYDKDGRIVRRDVNGVTVQTVVWDARRHIYTDELGHRTVREVDEWENLLRLTHPDKTSQSHTYDPVYSHVLTATDERGTLTQYQYDGKGNLIRRTDAAGTAEQRVTEYTYDRYGNVLDITRLSDAVSGEAQVSNTYDDFGNRKTETTRVSAGEAYTIHYESYDRMGNLLRWRDGRNQIWQQMFNGTGQRTSITDPLNHTTRYAYDGAGNLMGVTTADGKSTHYQIGIKGRLDKVIDADQNETRYRYNEKGQSAATYDEEGRATQLEYDSIGRVKQAVDGAGNTVSFEYGVVQQHNVTQAQVSAITHPTYREEFNYDSRGRLRQTTDYLTRDTYITRRRDYDALGNLTGVTDAEQKRTAYAYDLLNRRVKVTYPDGRTNRYAYDNRNNLLSVTNEKQIVIRRYQYDLKNRLTQESGPGIGTIQYFYDADDNLIRKVDGKGQVIVSAYDGANRLTAQTYSPVGTSLPGKTIHYSYNLRNRVIGYDDGQTSAVYTRDALQRKTSETVNFGPFSKILSRTYYKNSLAKTDTDAEGITRAYMYDAGNRLSQVRLPDEGPIIYSEYQWNRPKRITYPGGGTRELNYDPLMRLTHIIARDPGHNAVLNMGYGYDKVGNTTTRTTGQGTANYSYDMRYRLTRVNNPGQSNEGYTYDAAGNRLTDLSTLGAWTYNTANQLTAYGNITLNYDANGSLTTKTEAGQTTTYVYNQDDRLSEVKDSSNAVIVRYYYDPFGRRLWKEVGGVRTFFMYGRAGLVAEMDNTGTVMRSYGYAPQSHYGSSPLYQRSGGKYSYYQADRLGTPQALISKTGAVQWKGTAQAFGRTTEDISIKSNNLRFPGQYYDRETGLYYNHFRYYDPKTGRYISRDPLGLAAGPNLYAYVNNNPFLYSDPFGLAAAPNPYLPSLLSSYGTFCWEARTRYIVISAIAGLTGGATSGFGAGVKESALLAVTGVGMAAVPETIAINTLVGAGVGFVTGVIKGFNGEQTGLVAVAAGVITNEAAAAIRKKNTSAAGPAVSGSIAGPGAAAVAGGINGYRKHPNATPWGRRGHALSEALIGGAGGKVKQLTMAKLERSMPKCSKGEGCNKMLGGK